MGVLKARFVALAVLLAACAPAYAGRTSGGAGAAPSSTLAPPTTLSPSPSGVAMPVGDLPGWRQVFADDFLTPVPLGSFPAAVSSTWWDYPDGWKDTSTNGTYEPSKVVSVANGLMNLNLHTENGVRMVAAPVPKVAGAPHNNGQGYGRYSIRFRADTLRGYKLAWLLWPDSGAWPRDGEIDFPEGALDGSTCAFVHHQGAIGPKDRDQFCAPGTFTAWHTATIDWTPTSTAFALDGVTIGTSTTRIPRTSMHWVLQTETATGGIVPADTTAGDVQIDWVTMYAAT